MEPTKPAISQKDYLKRYLMRDKDKKSKKKKKRDKVSSSTHLKRSVIIDDDINISEIPRVVDDEFTLDHLGDEAPQIVGVVDERPEQVKLAERYGSGKWKPMESAARNTSENVKSPAVDPWGVQAKEPTKHSGYHDSHSPSFPSYLSNSDSRNSKGRYEHSRGSNCYKSLNDEDTRDKSDSDLEVPRSRNRVLTQSTAKGAGDSLNRLRRDRSNSPPRKGRGGHDSDFSHPRKRKGGSGSDLSPRRREKSYNGSEEPSSKRKTSGVDTDVYAQGRKNHGNNSDLSPPRGKKADSDSDLSPPRRKRGGNTQDLSTARRKKNSGDSDLSPPRRKKGGKVRDISPPQTRKHGSDSDLSPPRKKKGSNVRDLSPPRRTKYGNDSDLSPPGKNKSSNFQDLSPPRRKKGGSDSDLSPPRRRKSSYVRDLSPPRRKKGGSDSDVSPPRRKKLNHDGYSRLPSNENTSRELDKKQKSGTMFDGKRAGLQNAKGLKDELRLLKEKEDEMFRQMDPELLGRSTVAIVRDRKTGLKRDFEKEREIERQKAAKNAVRQKKYDAWGKGLKQVQEQEERVADMMHEMSKPLARYADDDDLERALKAQEREGDPMLEYIRRHQKESHSIDLTVGGSRKKYQGSYLPNRFNLAPGHRWDGVDRSNGYEQKWFAAKNAKKATAEEAWKWSSADM